VAAIDKKLSQTLPYHARAASNENFHEFRCSLLVFDCRLEKLG
jgi:hypothetical protein